jgi:hypothetical protein
MITEEGRAKDGKTITKDGMKDGKIIEVINMIKMTSLVKMCITKTTITGIITTEIMEISKEVIRTIFVAKKKVIRRMTIHYGSNI